LRLAYPRVPLRFAQGPHGAIFGRSLRELECVEGRGLWLTGRQFSRQILHCVRDDIVGGTGGGVVSRPSKASKDGAPGTRRAATDAGFLTGTSPPAARTPPEQPVRRPALLRAEYPRVPSSLCSGSTRPIFGRSLRELECAGGGGTQRRGAGAGIQVSGTECLAGG
jgi:hypothetical protein